MTERKSRLCRAVVVKDRRAKSAQQAISRTLGPLRDHVHTLTYDNGPEFSHHQKVNRDLGAKSFFAHPYHSWERGSNENMNGLLRQYFPKGKSMKAVTKTQINAIVERL
ncbi:IS30 family transposase [Rhodophyticola sp. CCM32]|nr:IS30 family transposase [Rhodophyticola sp. CCM32]QBY00211.1 IS30 family transposase [Rhodophyticola sp. CCM32]